MIRDGELSLTPGSGELFSQGCRLPEVRCTVQQAVSGICLFRLEVKETNVFLLLLGGSGNRVEG